MSDSGNAPLVQPEGTNAGSAAETDEAADTGGRGDGVTGSAPGTRGGGHAQDAPDPGRSLTRGSAPGDADIDDEVLGAPGDDGSEPSQEHGSSGQDAGSMD